jgi:large subunit ribosomal protein L29
MKAADLREKSPEDLRELEKTLVRDVFQNRLRNFTNRLDDTSAIRKTRRDLARVVTVLRERELGLTPVTASPAAEGASAPERKEAKPAKKAGPKVEAKAAATEAPVTPAESKPKKAASKAAATEAAASEAAEAPKKKSSTKAKKSEAK